MTETPPERREDRRLAIDFDKLEELAALNCTLAEAAADLGVSASTLSRRLKEPAYADAWNRGAGKGRVKLRRVQLKLAERSPTMAMHLGRELLGQNGPGKKPNEPSETGSAADKRSARDEIARRIAGIASQGRAPGDPERTDGDGGQ